ncbi:MAG: hypothetical protein QG635_1283 [Bacteroidota bacterium]|nr:hypothetical protein [Bacteroidota bacterium]
MKNYLFFIIFTQLFANFALFYLKLFYKWI